MNSQVIKFKLALVLSLLLLSSGCSPEDLDFDQTSNLESKPIYKVFISDFIPKIDLKLPQIPIGGNSITYIEPITVFNNSLFNNSFTEIELNFSIANKINSKFTIEVQLNQGTIEFDKIRIAVPAHSGVDFILNSPTSYTDQEIIQLKKVDNIIVKITCENLSASVSESITMNTRLTAYIKP